MESVCSNIVCESQSKLLFDLNNSPIPNIVSPAPINMNNNIDLGYSIISNDAENLNNILNEPTTSNSNIRTVIFTRQIDCSLVADEKNPEYEPIKRWSISNCSNDYKKVVHAGPSNVVSRPGNFASISTNKDLYTQQIIGLEKSIRCWCSKYLYPSGFAASNINHDMSKYNVFLGKSNSSSQNIRRFHSCYELIKYLKQSVNKPNLKACSNLETADCKNLQWTNYNKFTDTAVIHTVEQIVNPTIETTRSDSLYFDDKKFNNNYYNSINTSCNDTPCDADCLALRKNFPNVGDVSTGGYDACTNNVDAITYHPYLIMNANNFVNLQHVVYVDPFKENETTYLDEPVLLKLIFNTQFYFNYTKLPETITNENDPVVLRWNPSPTVYMPEPAEYFLIGSDQDISCCT